MVYPELPRLDFLDVGWGGDVKKLRASLPETFLNIRLSPVEILQQTEQEIHDTICRLVEDSDDPFRTGVCCINMDGDVEDAKIAAIFETVAELRRKVRSIRGIKRKIQTIAAPSKIEAVVPTGQKKDMYTGEKNDETQRFYLCMGCLSRTNLIMIRSFLKFLISPDFACCLNSGTGQTILHCSGSR